MQARKGYFSKIENMLQEMDNDFNNEYISWQFAIVFIIIQFGMNLSGKNSQKQKPDSSQIKNQPIIVLDSSENQQQKEMLMTKNDRYQEDSPIIQYVITSKTETPEQVEKRMAPTYQMIREINESRKNFQMPTRIPRPKEVVVLTKQQKRQRDEMQQKAYQLSIQKDRQQKTRNCYKQFNRLPHVPYQILKLVQWQLTQLSNIAYNFDNRQKLPLGYVRVRQQQRIKLITLVLINIQQLRQSSAQKNEAELMVCDILDPIQYSFNLVCEIENTFYKKLFKKPTQTSPAQEYKTQIRYVLNQLSDPDNTEFQRKIITQSYPLNDLATTNEQEMMCEKGRRKLYQQKRQFVRMFEKQNPEDIIFKTQTDRYYEQKERQSRNEQPPEEKKPPEESPEERLRKNRDEWINKNKKICKTTYRSMVKSIREMNERAQHLRSKGFEEVKDLSFTFDVEN